MEKSILLASCPVCGRTLFRGTPNSYMEGGCPKCREYLKVTFNDNGVSVSLVKNHEAGKERNSSPIV